MSCFIINGVLDAARRVNQNIGVNQRYDFSPHLDLRILRMACELSNEFLRSLHISINGSWSIGVGVAAYGG